MMTCQRNTIAFSLVELSIVLVILGLLVGGVLSSQSLIRASELRAVTTEYSRYLTAAQSFRDKYFAYPGDMTNATAFWGRQTSSTMADGSSTCVTNSGAAITANGVCDGDGNGSINYTYTKSPDYAQFWRELANAGLIEGTYSGNPGTAGWYRCDIIGTDCPRSKLSNAGWSAFWDASNNAETYLYNINYGSAFAFGGNVTYNSLIGLGAAVLKPEEAWNIDTKLDDGKPATGKVIARFWNNTCAAADSGPSTDSNLVASYKLTDSSVQCALVFKQIF